MAEARKAARLLAKPLAGLKSREAEERFTTAALLIGRYRTARPGHYDTVRIPAQESRLILTALAEADWNKRVRNAAMSPRYLFSRLGVTARDGWRSPDDFRDFAQEAKRWLRDNAGTFRLERFVWPGEDKTAGPEK